MFVERASSAQQDGSKLCKALRELRASGGGDFGEAKASTGNSNSSVKLNAALTDFLLK